MQLHGHGGHFGPSWGTARCRRRAGPRAAQPRRSRRRLPRRARSVRLPQARAQGQVLHQGGGAVPCRVRRVRLQAGREAPALPLPCLCVFDVDRTLTAMQGSTTATCPGIEASPGVVDTTVIKQITFVFSPYVSQPVYRSEMIEKNVNPVRLLELSVSAYVVCALVGLNIAYFVPREGLVGCVQRF